MHWNPPKVIDTYITTTSETSTAAPTFSTTPGLDITLPAWSDISLRLELKMSTRKPEVEITVERKEMVKRF